MHARSTTTLIVATFAALTAFAPALGAQASGPRKGAKPTQTDDGSLVRDGDARAALQRAGLDPRLWDDAVGRPPGGPDSIGRGVTYTERWVYESEYSQEVRIRVDLEGDLVVARRNEIEKIDVTPNTVGDVGPVWNGVVQHNAFSSIFEVEIDLDGNIYACGASGVGGNPRGVVRVSPSGFVMWERSLPGTFRTPWAVDLALSPDGVPFVVTGPEFPSVFRLDPNTGGVAWGVDLRDPEVQAFSSELLFPQITVDRRGNVFAVARDISPTGNDRTIVVALDGATGEVLWSAAPEIEVASGSIAQALTTDFDCNLYICGSPTQGQPADEQGLVIGYDIEGNRVLNRLIPFVDSDGSMDGYEVRLSIVESRPDGSLILAGRSGGVVNSEINAPYVTKLDADRNRVWSTPMYVPGTCSVCTTENTAFDDVFAIDFDRFGNVYCLNRIRTPSSTGFASTATVVERLNVDTGVR
ncbi:MAG: PQQ-binding-like beta-propeller repeat protein, partial [Planctomycetota bacterium]